MEAADDHRDAGGAELAGEVERARELVGLHADQADEAAARRCGSRAMAAVTSMTVLHSS